MKILDLINRLEARIHRYREHILTKKDASSFKSSDKIIFLDLGSNLGQGYNWFKKYYNHLNIKFELFEPNPYCCDELEKIPEVKSGKVRLNNFGVGINSGSYNLYGLDPNEGGKFAQGGSIVKEHNSDLYEVIENNAIKVNLINFSNYLESTSRKFEKIIVKMDIEGAEVDLLEHLIKEGTINHISILYVEFHSQYQILSQSRMTRNRERKILKLLSQRDNLKVRIWH